MHVTAFGLFGALLIIALIRRVWLVPRKVKRQRAIETAQRVSHEARVKNLKEIDLPALETWIANKKDLLT
jgi:hypothetical protein